MSSPQLGRDVYWRRRLLVLAVLIAIIWGIVQLVGLIRGDEDTTQPTAQDTPSAAAPQESQEPVAPEPETGTDPEVQPGQPVPLGLTTSADACEPENIRTVAMVPEGQKAGGPVDIELLISTIDATACTFTPKRRDFLVVIEANEKPIYDSTVCKESFLSSPVVIAQGFGTLVSTTWTGKGSGKACSTKEGFARGGKFTIKASAFGGEPDQTAFTLASAPKPTPTPTPSETADSKEKSKPSDKPTAKPSAKPSAKPTEPGSD